MPRFMMAVYGPAETTEFHGYESEADMRESMAETGAFNEKLKAQGNWVFADGLQPVGTAKVVDGQGGAPVVTDGPYPEAKEFIGGFWIIEAADLDAALGLAAEASKACRGQVEVRPFQTEFTS